MRSLPLAAVIFALLVVPALAAPASSPPTPPGATIQFGYGSGGSNNGFEDPNVTSSAPGLPLVAGGKASIELELHRFRFDPGCSDAATITTATVILRTLSGDQEVSMQVVPGYGAFATFAIPAEPTLRLGFVASTASGCEARDTRFEEFYSFSVDTGWKAPAEISFDASSQTPVPSGPLTAGDWLVVQYDPARANVAAFGTDGQGKPIQLSSARYQVEGSDQLDVSARVQFLDANGNNVGGVQTQTVVQTPSMGPATQPGYFKIPDGARSVSVFFEAETYSYDTHGSVGGAWDSNGGSNFRFAVQAPTPGLAGSLSAATSGP